MVYSLLYWPRFHPDPYGCQLCPAACVVPHPGGGAILRVSLREGRPFERSTIKRHCKLLIRQTSRDKAPRIIRYEVVQSWMCTYEHQNKPLHKMWGKVRSCLPSSLGSALLPQSLQGELSRACGPRPCPRQEVVRLPSSLDVIVARITQSPRRRGQADFGVRRARAFWRSPG
jgi:hypothetical protein